MTAHLDLEQLADLSAGVLDGPASEQAHAHLETCEHCRGEAAALDGLALTLRRAADVGPMPADVADRLDAALRAEHASSVTPENVTALPRPATRQWWAHHRVLQAAAAVVLVVAGGAIAVPLLDSAGGGESMTASKAGRSGQEEGGSGDAATSGGVLKTGTNYSEQTLSKDVTRLLTAGQTGRSAEESVAGRAAAPPAATRLADPQALAECLAQLPRGRGATPLLVDVARFDGRQATVIVLPRQDQPDLVDIWVVGSGCGNGNAQTLHYESAPRP